jgi:hypothetical protein
VDLARELVARRAVGEAPEVGRERGAPVDAYLPRPGLVGEEDDAVGIFVNAPEQREEQLEGLAHRRPRPLLGRANALADQPFELGDERLGRPRTCP